MCATLGSLKTVIQDKEVLTMTRTALKRAISQLSNYQIDKIQKMVLEYSLLNHELETIWPETCPKCGADEHSLIKKGLSRGKQRFQCKCSQKKYTYDSQQLTFYSHQPMEAWIKALEATLRLDPLDETARVIGVCRSTAFYMRHKLLAFMEKALDSGNALDGLVEADETYVPESQKGRKVTHRKARLHGEGVNLQGISHEQLCVCVATDRNHHVAARCGNRGRPTCGQIETALADWIANEVVFQCDGTQNYNDLIAHKNCRKIELKRKEDYDKVHHLNTVNGLHNQFKHMIRKFRDVSTIYLNRYLALFVFLTRGFDQNVAELADTIRRSLMAVRTSATLISLKSASILAI